jgi:hypothetical protein
VKLTVRIGRIVIEHDAEGTRPPRGARDPQDHGAIGKACRLKFRRP